ncbi:MAG: DUF374 domain-containing protein [Fibrobacterota bacterium]|nr:DUF374 domain-containing protein [Fibrobacterota bacterium]QQS03680.1 MAG: DUF374 domain-containing protein [Fibrobacterota bacterium]
MNWLIKTLVRLWMGTLRWRMAEAVPSGTAVFAFWHRNVPPAAAFFRNWPATALVSASRDGQILADLLEGGGLELVRASSSRGAVVGTRRLLASLCRGRPVVTAWDGPKGPANVAKPGPFWLAECSNAPLYEVLFESPRSVRLHDWSRMEFPWPFSVVTVRFLDVTGKCPAEGLSG